MNQLPLPCPRQFIPVKIQFSKDHIKNRKLVFLTILPNLFISFPYPAK